MSTHFIALSATARHWSWRPSDRFGGGQFGFLVGLPNETVNYNGKLVVLESQDFWLNVQVSEGQLQKRHYQSTMQKLQSVGKNSFQFLSTGGKIITAKSGKQSLKFNLAGARLKDNLGAAINRVVLDVQVVEVRDRWLLVGESYRIPNPAKGQKAFGERQMWVYLPHPMELSPRQSVYIEGHIAAKWPTGEKNLYVIADLVA